MYTTTWYSSPKLGDFIHGCVIVNDYDNGLDWVIRLNGSIAVNLTYHPAHSAAFSDPAYANGFFYVLDFVAGSLLRSVDGIAWDVLSAPACLYNTWINHSSVLIAANDQIFTACLNGTLEVLVDDIWEVTSLNSGSPVQSINYLSELSLYITSASSKIWYSKNGMDWNEESLLPTEGIFSTDYSQVVYYNDIYLAFNGYDIWWGVSGQ